MVKTGSHRAKFSDQGTLECKLEVHVAWYRGIGQRIFLGNALIEWMIYNNTHDTSLLTTLDIMEFIPIITTGAFVGALADRYNRKRLKVFLVFLWVFTMAVLAAWVILVGFDAIIVFVTVLVISSYGTTFNPASSALLSSPAGQWGVV